MLATERATVAQLNDLARAHLVHRGQIAKKTRTYKSPDDARAIGLAAGDEVILRRNDARLPQPHGDPVVVRNGMTGHVIKADRRGVTVRLDGDHAGPDGPRDVSLPASYVGAHVDYGYARTVDTAQGATVDHSLFAPSASTSAERAYVALSRGRESNRIYATTDRAWQDAIADPRGHTFATDQEPQLNQGERTTDLTAHRQAALGALLHRHTTADQRGSETSRTTPVVRTRDHVIADRERQMSAPEGIDLDRGRDDTGHAGIGM
jgi:hypothetical protein